MGEFTISKSEISINKLGSVICPENSVLMLYPNNRPVRYNIMFKILIIIEKSCSISQSSRGKRLLELNLYKVVLYAS